MKSKELSDIDKKNYNDYKKGFNKTFIISACFVLVISLLLSCFNACNCKGLVLLNTNCSIIDMFKDIYIGIIGVISIMLGFLFTAVSVFSSSVFSYYSKLKNEDGNKNKVNSYWNYVIKTVRYPSLFAVIIIFYLIFILVIYEILIQLSFFLVFYLFGIGISGVIIYMLFDRVFDYFSNPNFD